MAKVFARLDDRLRAFLSAQKMFFVASAPLQADGHVNISPKGLDDTFAILDDSTVAYLDLTGSGAETIAHARENGRIVLMFCAFSGPPRIVRLHGRADVIEPGDAEFAALRPRFGPHDGVRAIIRVRAERISDSCGYAVPLYEFRGQRTQLSDWNARKGPVGLEAYRAEHNATSLDGLPALRRK